MTDIIPAILTDSPEKFKELVRRFEPYAKRIHIDCADGNFVPNQTVKAFELIPLIESASRYDIHLMVREPAQHLKQWFYTHADRFIIHAESEGDLLKITDEFHKHNRKVGLAFNPETDIGSFEDIIKNFDFVQFMTVHPGFQGGKFVKEVVDKISAFHQKYPDIMIMADGGITPETAPQLAKAGVSSLVSGSYLVKSKNFEESINELKNSCTT